MISTSYIRRNFLIINFDQDDIEKDNFQTVILECILETLPKEARTSNIKYGVGMVTTFKELLSHKIGQHQ